MTGLYLRRLRDRCRTAAELNTTKKKENGGNEKGWPSDSIRRGGATCEVAVRWGCRSCHFDKRMGSFVLFLRQGGLVILFYCCWLLSALFVVVVSVCCCCLFAVSFDLFVERSNYALFFFEHATAQNLKNKRAPATPA